MPFFNSGIVKVVDKLWSLPPSWHVVIFLATNLASDELTPERAHELSNPAALTRLKVDVKTASHDVVFCGDSAISSRAIGARICFLGYTWAEMQFIIRE